MSKIPFSPITQDVSSIERKKQNQVAAPGFDSLLNNSSNNVEFASDFINNIISSISGNGADNDNSLFGFTPSFEATFGTSGPLPNFIKVISGKLKLSPTQIQAFQDIAVNNKDATKAPESVQKIARELKAAGITA
jgi:hypothetical protein